jgi:hypothetical protein
MVERAILSESRTITRWEVDHPQVVGHWPIVALSVALCHPLYFGDGIRPQSLVCAKFDGGMPCSSKVIACLTAKDCVRTSPLTGTNFSRLILDEFFTDSRPLGLVTFALGSSSLICAFLADTARFYSAFFSSKRTWTFWVLGIGRSAVSKPSMIRIAAIAYLFIGPI